MSQIFENEEGTEVWKAERKKSENIITSLFIVEIVSTVRPEHMFSVLLFQSERRILRFCHFFVFLLVLLLVLLFFFPFFFF